MLLLLAVVLASAPSDNSELAKMFDEDQADRTPAAGSSIDWIKVAPRDDARLARVKQMYSSDELKTGTDYWHAALILQHGTSAPEDALLAHELCVAALVLGEKRAAWLAAASEDRFLMRISRPQRFGTQFRSEGPDQSMELYTTDGAVTDSLRKRLSVPSLAEAKARAVRVSSPPRSHAPKDAVR